MTAPPRRIAWIIAPPELCSLCRQPLTKLDETSSWNGSPAHRDCVRIHLLRRDPAFRDNEGHEGAPDEAPDSTDAVLPKDEDEGDFGS